MSFGVGIGDVVAIIQTFERVAKEIRSYRDAPAQFQQLGAGLYLLQQALQRLLQVNPVYEAEWQEMELIRAIVIYCHRHVQAFVENMGPFESAVGQVKSSMTIRKIRRGF